MIKFFKAILISLAIFSFFGAAYADTAIHLDIKTPANTLYDQDITVTPCDSDNAGTLKITAYCAIRQSGIQNDWNWAWAPGAFLNSLGDISGYTTKDNNNNDVYHYWSWSLNGAEGTTGLNQYELQSSDLISLNFIDPSEPTPVLPPTGSGALLPPDILTTSSVVVPETMPAPVVKPIFDIKKAFEFLIAQQKENGSFGEDLYTDWIAIAFASGNYQEQTIKLVKYFGEFKTKDALLTNYERHAMALMALGHNPYNTNGENYIEKITGTFDNKQFGDMNEDNDDIFALIVLQNAGFKQAEKMITDTLDFIVSRQKENGSWNESVDMTGATIESLSVFSPISEIGESLKKAKEFLRQNQKDDGGWGNISSTAWAIQGILALGEKPEDWTKNGNTPLDYLASNQDSDGGIKNLSAGEEDENIQNKIWETAYVVSALSGKAWNQIMQKFEKPIIPAVLVETPIIQVAQNNDAKTIGAKPKLAKLKDLAKQNTATAITAITSSPTENKTALPKKNWFARLLENIFELF